MDFNVFMPKMNVSFNSISHEHFELAPHLSPEKHELCVSMPLSKSSGRKPAEHQGKREHQEEPLSSDMSTCWADLGGTGNSPESQLPHLEKGEFFETTPCTTFYRFTIETVMSLTLSLYKALL